MFRFSLATLLVLIAVFAVVFATLLLVPEWLRIVLLFIGVLALPGPLVVMCRYGKPASRAFALGGLVSYGVWFAVAGLPCALHAATQYQGLGGYSITGITTDSSGNNRGIVIYSYDLFAGLYAPWFVVLVAGIVSSLVSWLIGTSAITAEKPN